MTSDPRQTENSSSNSANSQSEGKGKIGFFKVMLSVFAAMFGVRANKYRERDFKHGKAIHFIIGGIIATAMFILVVYTLVQYALKSAGA